MSFWVAALSVCAVATGLGYLATRPEELRELRWLKIVASMPPILIITWASYDLNLVNACFGTFSFAILAFLWKSPIAYAGSLLFMRMIQGDMNRLTTGVRAEFGAAKALHKHGDLDDALKHTRAELEKEPYSYEGLLLLAQIHIDLDQPERAMKAVDLILERTQLTEDQRKLIQQTRKAVEESLLLTK
jgi:hypothetical protein